MSMAFEQATIKIQKEEEFAKLRAASGAGVLAREYRSVFLKQLDRKGIRVRSLRQFFRCERWKLSERSPA